MTTLADQYISRLIQYEVVNSPGHIELEKAIDILRDFYHATVKECEERILTEKNFKILRGER